jgi:hypothetical protein
MFEITQTMGLQCLCLHWEGVRKCGVKCALQRHDVVQLVVALGCKLEGHGFNT